MTDKEENKQVYMVFTYDTSMGGITKFVRGIYLTPEEAVARQKEIIPVGSFGVNGSRCGWGKCAFVNVFPLGKGNTELHTTSIPNWSRYA